MSDADGQAASRGNDATGASNSSKEAATAAEASVSVNFLLRNFTEMNKLWTRMQRSMPASDARDSIRTVRLLSLLQDVLASCCTAS